MDPPGGLVKVATAWWVESAAQGLVVYLSSSASRALTSF